MTLPFIKSCTSVTTLATVNRKRTRSFGCSRQYKAIQTYHQTIFSNTKITTCFMDTRMLLICPKPNRQIWFLEMRKLDSKTSTAVLIRINRHTESLYTFITSIAGIWVVTPVAEYGAIIPKRDFSDGRMSIVLFLITSSVSLYTLSILHNNMNKWILCKTSKLQFNV